MTWVPHLTVATIVERDGRFLLVEETIAGRRVYNQPAGHLEDGETILEAAVRETLEETGWTVEPVALVGVYQWRHPGNGETFVRFCFTARPLRHHPDRPLDAGIQRAVWLSRSALADLAGQLRSPLVLRCIDDYLSGNRHPLDVVRHIASP
ncbi:MAG: NUDIX hydrolase [Pseudomonadota bacterium]|nr:NUDIX hydrolase [Pseudomonadota bacterium]